MAGWNYTWFHGDSNFDVEEKRSDNYILTSLVSYDITKNFSVTSGLDMYSGTAGAYTPFKGTSTYYVLELTASF
jgi:hypothetical protein